MVLPHRAARSVTPTRPNPARPYEEGEQDMVLHRRNVIKLSGALVVALSLALSAPLLQAQSGKTEVLWLGQATFKITSPGGKVIVTDPFLSGNPKTPTEYKDLAKLGKVDLVLVTHGHGDHVGTVGRTERATRSISPSATAPRCTGRPGSSSR